MPKETNPDVDVQTYGINDEDVLDAHRLDDMDPHGVIVKPKWRGTSQDRIDMVTLERHQTLRRNFRFLSMLGFGSTLICTWEIILATIAFILTDGGTANLFWGFIACSLGLGFTYASIAEMASMAPTAGGQYHWVSEFAPRKYQKFWSYIVGWLCATGWQSGMVGATFTVGTVIQGLVILNHPTYIVQRWHGTVLVWAVGLFCVIFNTVLAKKLPAVEGIVLTIHIMGLFAIIIPLWILSPRATAHEALLTFSNNGGWPSTGLSSMIGLLSPMYSLIGFDCAVHMSEEVEDAGKTLPRAIMWSVYLNCGMGFIMAVTMCFCLGDIESILQTDTGYPFIQVFFNATKSREATNVMVTIIIITLTSSAISVLATASRQLWSFARDKGLPFSNWLANVDASLHIPLRSVIIALVITCLVSLINIGSNAALNAIASLAVVATLTSYWITTACLIHRRLFGEPLPPRRWSLGRAGLPINVISLAFLTPVYFFAFWPEATPVTAETMNWAVVMYSGVMIWALIYYIVWGRHVYRGPVVVVKRTS